MDIVDICTTYIETQLSKLDNIIEDCKSADASQDGFVQTQTAIDAVVADKDKNLDRILDQQAHIKMIIERDGRIKSLRKSIIDDRRCIESIRKSCAKFNMDAIKGRQVLLEDQAKDLERFQIQQMKSITQDYERLQKILEQRKVEIVRLKKEAEEWESNREAYLAQVEKDQERLLRHRQLTGHSSGLNITDEVHNPEHIELASIDEFAPYGTAPNSRASTNQKRGGGRRKRGAA